MISAIRWKFLRLFPEVRDLERRLTICQCNPKSDLTIDFARNNAIVREPVATRFSWSTPDSAAHD
jgi:hypothetical protein